MAEPSVTAPERPSHGLLVAEGRIGAALGVTFAVLTVLSARGTDRTVAAVVLMAVAQAGLWTAQATGTAAEVASRWMWRTFGIALAAVCGLVVIVLAPRGVAEVPVFVAAARLPLVTDGRVRQVVLGLLTLGTGVAVALATHSLGGLLAGCGVPLIAQRTVTLAELRAERDLAVEFVAQLQAGQDAVAEAAAVAERASIARELHDVLAHSLSGLSVQLQAARAVAARRGVDAAVTGPLDRAAELAREGIAEARGGRVSVGGGVRVLILTTYADDEAVIPALTAGAAGYLTKDTSGEDLVAAIMAVAGGATVLDPAIQATLVARLRHPATARPSAGLPEIPDGLTRREVEVIRLVAEGLTNQQLARRLVVGEATVKTHINHILAKLEVDGRAGLVSWAWRHGLAG